MHIFPFHFVHIFIQLALYRQPHLYLYVSYKFIDDVTQTKMLNATKISFLLHIKWNTFYIVQHYIFHGFMLYMFVRFPCNAYFNKNYFSLVFRLKDVRHIKRFGIFFSFLFHLYRLSIFNLLNENEKENLKTYSFLSSV